jgi:hypothetical protein
MVVAPAKTIYLLDTNVLIGLSLWKPMSLKLNDIFWTEFTEALKQGAWILLDVVADEVKFDTELVAWCKEQKKNKLITELDDDSRDRAVEINKLYPMIDQTTFKSEVDTFIIAYAEANSFGIFSRESPRVGGAGLYKIPDVCDSLHIKRLSKPKAFLKEIGFN